MRTCGSPRDRFLQRLDRARFADPGLADHGDDLALALACQAPAVEQQPHFVRAADERQIAAGTDRGEAALDRRFAAHAPGRHRARKSFQFVFAGGFELEQSAEQTLGRLADQDSVGRRQRLQPRREIGRLADDGALLRACRCQRFRRPRPDRWRCRPGPEAARRPGARCRPTSARIAERRANRALGGILEGAAESRNRRERRRP